MAVYLGSNKVAAHGGLPSGGGGGGSVEAKDVNFYDYDGTIVASYSKNDFLALTQMPSNPDHSGDDIPLTSQGWNWSLADAKTYVTSYGMLEIGQMYKPTDGKTHLVIEIPAKTPSALLTYYVRCTPTVATGVTIDWADGNTTTTNSTSAKEYSHTYAAPGTYDITLNVTSGKVSFAGSSSYAIYGLTSNTYNRGRLKRVHVGSNVSTLGNYILNLCYRLEILTIPKDITADIGQYMATNCYSLKAVIVPSTASAIGLSTSAFQGCNGAVAISLPKSINNLGNSCLRYMYSIKRLTLPNGSVTVGTYTVADAFTLRKAVVPNGPTGNTVNLSGSRNLQTLLTAAAATPNCSSVYLLTDLTIASGTTSISNSSFSGCYGLTSVTVPSTVTSIGTAVFNNCYSLAYIHMLPTSPPTLADQFSGVNANVKIVVPDSAVNDYKTAADWSSLSDRIIGESDWNPA